MTDYVIIYVTLMGIAIRYKRMTENIIAVVYAYCKIGSFDKHPQYMCTYIDEILLELKKMEGKYEKD